ncbi:MAG: S-methyl-5-thioribose-1-phosphate isomerase [Candidatus Omnitrophica bacterium]|nr:S-methyl-5-thioribose-1-phosphate isomerase [Candidatus Omnitrophota bacterium]
MPVNTVEWKNNSLRLIDQRLLPGQLKYITCKNTKQVFEAIKKLKVRGAPAIGVTGAFGMYIGARAINTKSVELFCKSLEKVGDHLGSSRPTARNLFWAIETMLECAYDNIDNPVEKIKTILLKEAKNILEQDKLICRKIGQNGASLIKKGDTLLTHCNAGALATADFGTALAPMYIAKKKGVDFSVFVDETRPVLQGARLTAWELVNAKIKATLICDNMAASLMKSGKIDKVITGADRIAVNGDTANKIGTYNLAVLCKYHKIPFYIAAPISTFDLSLKSGKDIVIEERGKEEVISFGGRITAPKNIKVYNPSFDVTPHELITGIITEKGIITYPCKNKIIKHCK